MAKVKSSNTTIKVLLAGFGLLLFYNLWIASALIDMYADSSIPGLFDHDYMLGLGYTNYYILYIIIRVMIILLSLVMLWKWRQGSTKAYQLILAIFVISSLFSLTEEVIYLWTTYQPNYNQMVRVFEFTRLNPLLVFNNPVLNVVLNFATLAIVLKNKPSGRSQQNQGATISDILDQPN